MQHAAPQHSGGRAEAGRVHLKEQRRRPRAHLLGGGVAAEPPRNQSVVRWLAAPPVCADG